MTGDLSISDGLRRRTIMRRANGQGGVTKI